MRRKLLGTVAFGAAVFLVLPTVGATADPGDERSSARQTGPATAHGTAEGTPDLLDEAALRQMLGSSSTAERRAREQARERAAAGLPKPVLVKDDEPDGTQGGNDNLGSAQFVDGFGTGAGENPRLRVLGGLATPPTEPHQLDAAPEDNGAIPSAHDLGLSDQRPSVRITGRIGDGPHGSNGDQTGDYDVYEVQGVPGQTLSVDLTKTGGDLVPSVVLLDADGGLVTGVQPLAAGENTIHLSHRFDQADTYYLVAGSATPYPVPGDPFDSGSGFGVGTEGKYGMTVTADWADVDFYAVRLAPGDVLGASVEGDGRRIEVYGPDGQQVHGSGMDGSAIYPASSPLPGGGNGVVDHVTATGGTHYVAIADGSGRYDATVEVYRPKGESQARPQELFLDFDGARVDNRIFQGAATEPGVRKLSRFRSFLNDWGLRAKDESAVIDEVVSTVEENLAHDLPGTRVRVESSKDHEDDFGDKNVSRVIVGGTVEEAGIIPVIGIAQSIDPGNFAWDETALVLLDTMSAPKSNPASINAYLTDKSDRIAAVGQAIGNVVSHEAGHYLGNWHTHTANDVPNVMDTGDILGLYGVGPDGVAGTDDDADTDFVPDAFEPLQGFSGTEDTAARTSIALTQHRWLP